MKVLVTGGTGFVGSHTAAALIRSGHDVRLLARSPERVVPALAPHGVQIADIVPGDALDPDAVARALEGCDAVVHAAAVYSVDPRRVSEVRDTNETATRIVLGKAVEAGLDPVVHISSTVALTGTMGGGPEMRLGDLSHPYTASKRRSEEIARQFQDQGAPVVTVYPGGCFGPHDPYLGDQNFRLRWVVLGRFPLWPAGGYHATDVRTVAEVVVAAMEPGRGPRRFVVPGVHLDASTLYGTVASVTGRHFPHLVLPKRVVGPMTASVDALQRLLPASWHFPADHEGAMVSLADTRMVDSATRTELGIQPRPFEETIRDTLAWMAESGHISRRAAGRAVPTHA